MQVRQENEDRCKKLRTIAEARDARMLAELKRVRGLSDSDFAAYTLSLIGRQELWHHVKRQIKKASLSR
jgi:hypothetical protein